MDLGLFTPAAIVIVTLGFFLGGLSKGATGIGLPLIAVPVAAIILPPKVAIALMAGPILASNLWMVVTSPQTPAMARRFWPLLLLSLPFCALGTYVLVSVPVHILEIWLGAAVLAVVALQLFPFRPQIPPRHEKLASAVTGIVGGTLQGVSGFSGPAFSIFLLSIRADKNTFAVACTVVFFVSSRPLVAILTVEGVLAGQEWLVSALLPLPVLFGVWCGQRVRHRIPEARFRAVLLCLLAVIGTPLMLEGFGLI